MRCTRRSKTPYLLQFRAQYMKRSNLASIFRECYWRFVQKMVRCFLFPRIQVCPKDRIYLKDSAPPQNTLEARKNLDRKLLNRWLVRGGPMEWPSCSLDLTACDQILWGYIIYKSYRDHSWTMAETKTKIHQQIQTIDQETLISVFRYMELG